MPYLSHLMSHANTLVLVSKNECARDLWNTSPAQDRLNPAYCSQANQVWSPSLLSFSSLPPSLSPLAPLSFSSFTALLTFYSERLRVQRWTPSAQALQSPLLLLGSPQHAHAPSGNENDRENRAREEEERIREWEGEEGGEEREGK